MALRSSWMPGLKNSRGKWPVAGYWVPHHSCYSFCSERRLLLIVRTGLIRQFFTVIQIMTFRDVGNGRPNIVHDHRTAGRFSCYVLV